MTINRVESSTQSQYSSTVTYKNRAFAKKEDKKKMLS